MTPGVKRIRKRPIRTGTVPAVAAAHDSRRRWRRWAPLGLAVFALVVSGCAKDAPLDTFKPKGHESQLIQDLQVPVFIIAGVIGVLVILITTFIMVRFRRKKGHEGDVPKQIHGAPRLEVMWTILPGILLAGVAIFTINTLFKLAETPKNPLNVTVIGQQWW